MKFELTERKPQGCLHGRIVSCHGAVLEFCRRYREVVGTLIDDSSADLHPVILDPWPFKDTQGHLRRIYDSDQDGEPVLHAAVLQNLNTCQFDDPLVVAIPPSLASDGLSDAEIVLVVVMDAASWEADNTPTSGYLSWAEPEIKRAAIAAVLLRGAESAGLIDTRAAVDLYKAICAGAVEGLAARRHDENAEVLLVREVPGLVTVLHSVVEEARLSTAPVLPMSIEDAGAEGMRIVARMISSATGCTPRNA